MTHALAERLTGLTVSGVSAGLHVLLNLPAEVNDCNLERSARHVGIAVEALAR